jgi:hypothetical protein
MSAMARGGKREGAGRPIGRKNKRTAAAEAAALVVAARFKAEVPTAFDGDGVAFLQVVYRDPGQPIEVRIDAAKAAARFERPQLAAVMTNDASNISPLGAVLIPYKALVQSEVPTVIGAAAD